MYEVICLNVFYGRKANGRIENAPHTRKNMAKPMKKKRLPERIGCVTFNWSQTRQTIESVGEIER